MRIHLQRAFAALVPALLCLGGTVQAQNEQSPSDQKSPTTSYYAEGSESRQVSTGETAATPAAAPGWNTCPACDCDDFCAACENCPKRGMILFSGFDSWRGVADGNRQNNNGGSSGFNYGTRLGRISDVTGIAFQAGGSFGLFDFSGRSNVGGTLNTVDAQTQTFFTAGFFKKANENSPISYGIVHDWQANQNFGVFATNPTLGQWRGQVAYATSATNEFGAWGTLRDKGSSNINGLRESVSYRSINQVNFFWHHKWELGADTWIWAGLPQQDRLVGGGSLGDFLYGGMFTAPLNNYVGVYASAQYMHPSAAPGPAASAQDSWNVSMGLQYYIGGHARTNTVAGNCWLPLMPVANNGSFLVDASRNSSVN